MMHIVYDDSCPYCVRGKNVLERFRNIELVGISKFNNLQHNLKKENLLKELHLIDDGKVYLGYFAIKQIWKKIWIFSPLYLLSLIPGVDFLGNLAYRWVANRRHRQN